MQPQLHHLPWKDSREEGAAECNNLRIQYNHDCSVLCIHLKLPPQILFPDLRHVLC